MTLELYQAEWCPSSHRIRERLTELGLDYLVHQVPAERGARTRLRAATGVDGIPVLVLADGTVLAGEAAIGPYLDGCCDEPPGAEAHRRKAEEMHRQAVDEECACAESALQTAR